MPLRKQNILLLGLVSAFMLNLSCTRKPRKQVVYGSSEGIYTKEDFVSRPFVVGDAGTPASVATFIDQAVTKEQSQKKSLSLVAVAGDFLHAGSAIRFTVSSQFLTLHAQDNDNPIAQWSISGHCQLEPQHNQKGEETRFIEYRCSKGTKDNLDYPAFAADYNNVRVRDLGNVSELVIPKSQMLGELGLAQRTYTVKTGSYKNKGLAVTQARELVLEEGFTGFNDLRPVEFDAPDLPFVAFNDKILADIEFLGKENTSYQLRFRLTDHHLLVEKVVSSEGVGPQEKTYAQKIDDNLYAVTIVGYPINTLKYEHQLSQGEKTVNFVGLGVTNIEEATHIVINEKMPRKFASVQKQDVFDADFFKADEEWYFERSLIDRPIDTVIDASVANLYPGTQLAAGKVRVHKNKNSVQFLDVNIPEEAKGIDGEKLKPLLEIPATWVDFRVITTGGEAFLREESLEDGHPGANEWDKRQYAIFQFNRADNLSSARTDEFKLKKLEIGPNYIGFQVYYSSVGLTIKYSMVKATEKNITERIYPKADQQKFGFFATLKSFYPGITNDKLEIRDKNIVLQRANPERDPKNGNKPTVWIHLTKGMENAPYLVEAVQEAVDSWTKTFAKAAEGTGQEPISVMLSPELVEVGDVRYNKVVFWGYDYDTQPSGYGPSVTDQTNGNIVNASNHIFLRRYREVIYSEIRRYIRNELGLYEGKILLNADVPQNGKLAAGGEIDLISKAAVINGNTDSSFNALGLGNVNEKLGLNGNVSHLYISPIEEKISEVDFHDVSSHLNFKESGQYLFGKEEIANLNKRNQEYGPAVVNTMQVENNGGCSYPGGLINTFEQIHDLCDGKNGKATIFKAYLDGLRQQSSATDLANDDLAKRDEAFFDCAKVLFREKIASTLVHEFGHNFGMSHNFAASADADNYSRDEKGNILARMSSVMEYPDGDEDSAKVPGPYDIAAIRYAYYNSLEVNDPQSGKSHLISLKNGLNIDENIKNSSYPNDQARKYLFCMDTEILGDAQFPIDKVYCRRWDKGATATERVDAAIERITQSLMTGRSRFDSANIADGKGFAKWIYGSAFITLRIIYDDFRLTLASKTGLSDKYLTSISSQKELEQAVKNTNDPALWDSYLATRKAYKFLKELALMPSLYCVAVDGERKKIKSFAFDDLRQKIFFDTQAEFGNGKTVNNCQEATPYILGYDEVGQLENPTVETVGNALNDLTASADPLKILTNVPNLEIGILFVRALAIELLFSRDPSSALTIQENFKSSFMDEKELRDDFAEDFFTRISHGVSFTEALTANKEILPLNLDPQAPGYYQNFFYEEKGLLSSIFFNFLTKISPPGVQTKRLDPYLVNISGPNDIKVQMSARKIDSVDQYFYEMEAEYTKDRAGNFYWATAKGENVVAYSAIKALNEVKAYREPSAVEKYDEATFDAWVNKMYGMVLSFDQAIRVMDQKSPLFTAEADRSVAPSKEDLVKLTTTIEQIINMLKSQKKIKEEEIPRFSMFVQALMKVNYFIGYTDVEIRQNEELNSGFISFMYKWVLDDYARYEKYIKEQREFDAKVEILESFLFSQLGIARN